MQRVVNERRSTERCPNRYIDQIIKYNMLRLTADEDHGGYGMIEVTDIRVTQLADDDDDEDIDMSDCRTQITILIYISQF